MTVKETSEYLRMPIPTVYYNVQKGIIPTIKIGGRWRILRDQLDAEHPGLSGGQASGAISQADANKLIESLVRQLALALGR